MIDYKKAQKILLNSKIDIGNEKVKVSESLNRICSSNIYSRVNYPSGNNAAFDGYAIFTKDTNNITKKCPQKFKILKTIAAGDNPKIKKFNKFDAIEVMTGALIPKPFNTIIPIEEIKFYPSVNNKKYILLDKKIKKKLHVRYMGSDYTKKELVIKKGVFIQPSHILAFKSLGIKKIIVKKKPNVLFFSTGNEISNKQKIPIWKIRNSNNYYIKSLANNFHFNFINGKILKDKDENLFFKLIKKNLTSKIDIIITSGAVSAGKFDFVPTIVKKFNLSHFFKGVSIRPGKPILFAKFKNKNKVFFGLPGNPISSAACFRFFVYPYLLNILNLDKEKPFKAKLKNEFKKRINFTRFVKASLSSTSNGNLEIEILKGQESFRVKSFIKSNVWGVFGAGKSSFKKGSLVDCYNATTSNKNIFN